MGTDTPEQDRSKKNALDQLAALQAEIDDDLTHGRISQTDYEWTSNMIAIGIRHATEPLPHGSLRLVEIPKKSFDTKAYARVALDQAMRALREKRRVELERDRGK